MTEPDEAAWDAAAERHERAAVLLAGEDLAAEPEARAAVAALEAVLGGDHPDVANALDTLAGALELRGANAEALGLRRKAGAIVVLWRHERVADPIRSSVLRGLAYALIQEGAYEEAAAHLVEATAAARRGSGARSEAMADCLELEGVLHKLQGRYDAAAAAYARAERLYRAHGEIPAAHLHNKAGLATARGDHASAERHARACLDVRKRAGDGPLAVAADLAGLADALVGLGRLTEAVDAYRETLRLLEEAGHGAHMEAAYATHNLADALADLGATEEAERRFREAIARKEVLFGRRHHEVAASLNNLAAMLAEARPDEARTLSDEAVAIAASLAEDHPVRVGCQGLAERLRG